MPEKALGLEHESMARLEKIGVIFVKDVDNRDSSRRRSRFRTSWPSRLGPGAVKVLELVRKVQ